MPDESYAPYSEGPPDAKIALIGEAPGEKEQIAQRPFVGAAGELLNSMLANVGIIRQACYIDNVFQFRPDRNDIKPYLDTSKKNVRTSDAFTFAKKTLKDRLERVMPNVVVAFGNSSLYALTGRTRILKQRGSILNSDLIPGLKVIPVVHPAALLHGQGQNRLPIYHRYAMMSDLARVSKESEYPEIRLPVRKLIISPTSAQVLGFLDGILHKKGTIAFDIETKGKEVSHLSIATSPTTSMCIPMVEGARDWWTLQQEADVWRAITKVLEDPEIIKVGQNVVFDATMLFRRFGIRVWPLEDTFTAMGIVAPEFPKGLDFIVSIYCGGEPYYKDDGKEWFKNPFGSEKVFRRYSAMDSAVTLEAFHGLKNDLIAQNNWESYRRKTQILRPIVFMGEHGMAVDIKAMRDESAKAGDELSALKKKFTEQCGGLEINTGSSKQLMNYFYVSKGIKPYTKWNGKESRPTLDEKALIRLANRGIEEAQTLLEIRNLDKLKGTYLDMEFDNDNRIRCSFNPVGTKAGRLSSSKTIFGTGGNFQNLDPRAKKFLRPDSGYIFVSLDLSQAENRVVAYVANERNMISAFEGGIDIHCQTAGLIYSTPVEEVIAAYKAGDDEERSGGKTANHALNYDMTANHFSVQYQMPFDKSSFIVERYHVVYPGVREWHRRERESLRKNRTLTNLFGLNRRFIGPLNGRDAKETFKEAYSFRPQSTVAEIINTWGLAFFYDRAEPDGLFGPAPLLNQIHDSIVFAWPADNLNGLVEAILALKASLEQPLEIEGREFSIPVETQIGPVFDKGKMLTIDSDEWTNTSEAEIKDFLAKAA